MRGGKEGDLGALIATPHALRPPVQAFDVGAPLELGSRSQQRCRTRRLATARLRPAGDRAGRRPVVINHRSNPAQTRAISGLRHLSRRKIRLASYPRCTGGRLPGRRWGWHELFSNTPNTHSRGRVMILVELQARRPPLPEGRLGAGEREDYTYNRTRSTGKRQKQGRPFLPQTRPSFAAMRKCALILTKAVRLAFCCRQPPALITSYLRRNRFPVAEAGQKHDPGFKIVGILRNIGMYG